MNVSSLDKKDQLILCEAYFNKESKTIKVDGKLNKSHTEWECQCCLRVVKADFSHGINKLVKHILNRHRYECLVYLTKLKDTSPGKAIAFFDAITSDAKKYYNYIELLILANQPFSFIENEVIRRHINLDIVSRKAIVKYTCALSNEVCLSIKDEFPDKFGMIIDGWKGFDNVYYLAIFASYINAKGEHRKPLLALCPPTYQIHHNLESYRETIQATLHWYGKDIKNAIYLAIKDIKSAPLGPEANESMLSSNLEKTSESPTKRQKLSSADDFDFKPLPIIPPTSCNAEGLFSNCGLNLTKLGFAMHSKVFESRMILTENQSYWMNQYEGKHVTNDRGFAMMQTAITRIQSKEKEGEEEDEEDAEYEDME